MPGAGCSAPGRVPVVGAGWGGRGRRQSLRTCAGLVRLGKHRKGDSLCTTWPYWMGLVAYRPLPAPGTCAGVACRVAAWAGSRVARAAAPTRGTHRGGDVRVLPQTPFRHQPRPRAEAPPHTWRTSSSVDCSASRSALLPLQQDTWRALTRGAALPSTREDAHRHRNAQARRCITAAAAAAAAAVAAPALVDVILDQREHACGARAARLARIAGLHLQRGAQYHCGGVKPAGAYSRMPCCAEGFQPGALQPRNSMAPSACSLPLVLQSVLHDEVHKMRYLWPIYGSQMPTAPTSPD